MKTAERIYFTLKEEIQNHELKPGSSVSIIDLAKRLKTSPTPVREAISRLEQEGLIVSKNGKKIVFVLTASEINQIFDLKKSIESSIAALAVERGKETNFKDFEKLIIRMQDFQKRLDRGTDVDPERLSAWLKFDGEFHDLLYSMAENGKAKEIISLLNLQWHRFRLALLSLPGMLEKSIEEHIAIGNAVIAKDKEGCSGKMALHLEQVRRSLLTVINLFNPYSM